MAKYFEIREDLPAITQEKLTQFEAVSVPSSEETLFLSALEPYRYNRVLRFSLSGNKLSTKNTLQRTDDTASPILEAQGRTLPTGYANFAVGADFWLLNVSGQMVRYINTGTTSSAVWSKVGGSILDRKSVV